MAALNPTEQEFDALLDGGKPVLAEFWAPWCSYCRRIAPVLKKLGEERQDIAVAQINTDEQAALAGRYGIEVLPTLLLFQNGQPGQPLVAPESKAQIDSFITGQL